MSSTRCRFPTMTDTSRWSFFSYLQHWFFEVDPKWTEENLLALLKDGTTEEQDAWWVGYLWGMNNIPSYELSQRLKPHLFAKVAERGNEDHDRRDGLVSLVLASWVYSEFEKGEVRISDSELRNLLLAGGDDFRAQAIWHMESRGKSEGEDGQRWKARQDKFLRDVWPVQRAA